MGRFLHSPRRSSLVPRPPPALSPGTRWGDEGGSAVILMAMVGAVAVLAMLVVAVTAEAAVHRSQAQWAADAAALAAAGEGPGRPSAELAARRLATANGAVLIALWTPTPSDPEVRFVAVVEVERNGVRAVAAAARSRP